MVTWGPGSARGLFGRRLFEFKKGPNFASAFGAAVAAHTSLVFIQTWFLEVHREQRRNNIEVKTPCNSEELSMSHLLINYIQLNRTNEQKTEDSRLNKKHKMAKSYEKIKFQIETLEKIESCWGVL